MSAGYEILRNQMEDVKKKLSTRNDELEGLRAFTELDQRRRALIQQSEQLKQTERGIQRNLPKEKRTMRMQKTKSRKCAKWERKSNGWMKNCAGMKRNESNPAPTS